MKYFLMIRLLRLFAALGGTLVLPCALSVVCVIPKYIVGKSTGVGNRTGWRGKFIMEYNHCGKHNLAKCLENRI